MANTDNGALERTVDLAIRLGQAWRRLSRERRLAAFAAFGLFVTLFLPWYEESVIASNARARGLQAASETLTGWGTFGFAEAFVLVVAVGVLVLLFYRAESHGPSAPGADGWVISLAGGWACLLIIWRMIDKQGATTHGQYASTAGIEWGIFAALLAAAGLAYAGNRIRRAPLAGPTSAAGSPPAPGSPSAAGSAPAAGSPLAGTQPAATQPTGRPSPTWGPAPRASASAAAFPRASTPAATRSSWRPAERPDWSEPERPVGWLTAPPKPAAGSLDETAQPPRPPATGDEDQLTIPLDGDE